MNALLAAFEPAPGVQPSDASKEGIRMKRPMLVLIIAMFAASVLPGQAPTKPAANAAKTAATHKPASSQELNIQAYIKLLREDVNKEKSQIVAEVMQFDASDAAIFWPIYKDFQGDLAKVGDQIVDLVKTYVTNYGSMTNEVADSLANKLLDIEQQRNELKRKYYERFKAALDPITAARFLQVENQLERVIDLQIASQLPVVNESAK
jgi:flagellar biosynthesis chaperone FliJ